MVDCMQDSLLQRESDISEKFLKEQSHFTHLEYKAPSVYTFLLHFYKKAKRTTKIQSKSSDTESMDIPHVPSQGVNTCHSLCRHWA